jgi:hypothetical protein
LFNEGEHIADSMGLDTRYDEITFATPKQPSDEHHFAHGLYTQRVVKSR